MIQKELEEKDMNVLDMKVYNDGNRMIVVFNNVKPDAKKIM